MSASSKNESTENEPTDVQDSRAPAEKISFSIAIAILTVIISGVGYLWISDRNQQPSILQISSERSEQRKDSYYVPFTVTNSGGETAAAVQVIAELRVEGDIVEWGEQRVDFLSREEKVTGAFVFTRNPEAGELTIRVASYSTP